MRESKKRRNTAAIAGVYNLYCAIRHTYIPDPRRPTQTNNKPLSIHPDLHPYIYYFVHVHIHISRFFLLSLTAIAISVYVYIPLSLSLRHTPTLEAKGLYRAPSNLPELLVVVLCKRAHLLG